MYGRSISEKVQQESNKEKNPDGEKVTEKYEVFINYAQDEMLWIRNKIKDIGVMFSFSVSKEIDLENDDPDPKSILEC